MVFILIDLFNCLDLMVFLFVSELVGRVLKYGDIVVFEFIVCFGVIYEWSDW